MIKQLKPYPQYKDSGVPWLGKVPAHWEVRRLRNVVEMRVSNVDKHHKEGEVPVRLCNYMDVYKRGRIRNNMEFMKATASPEEIEKFRLERGDVLITKDSEAWDDIGVPALVESSKSDLISGYHLALLRPKHLVKGTFLFRALQSRPVAFQFHVEARGVTRYGLSHHAIKSSSVPLPPLPEQAAIVRFLDWAERRIRKAIRLRQRRIQLLQEYKQALIHQAVTGQIDVRTGQPYPAYKDSGVEWLGKVPKHWEVVPLRWLISIKSGDSIETEKVSNESSYEHPYPVIGGNGVMGYSAKVNSNGVTIVLGRVGALCGNVHLVTQPSWITDNALRIDRFKGFLAEFLSEELRSMNLNRLANSNAQPLITGAMIKAQSVAKPSFKEQTAIVNFLEKQKFKIDAAISADRRAIELLKELRTTLIAEVVTGKLDVQEAAAQLPEMSESEAEDFVEIEEEPTQTQEEETFLREEADD